MIEFSILNLEFECSMVHHARIYRSPADSGSRSSMPTNCSHTTSHYNDRQHTLGSCPAGVCAYGHGPQYGSVPQHPTRAPQQRSCDRKFRLCCDCRWILSFAQVRLLGATWLGSRWGQVRGDGAKLACSASSLPSLYPDGRHDNLMQLY